MTARHKAFPTHLSKFPSEFPSEWSGDPRISSISFTSKQMYVRARMCAHTGGYSKWSEVKEIEEIRGLQKDFGSEVIGNVGNAGLSGEAVACSGGQAPSNRLFRARQPGQRRLTPTPPPGAGSFHSLTQHG